MLVKEASAVMYYVWFIHWLYIAGKSLNDKQLSTSTPSYGFCIAPIKYHLKIGYWLDKATELVSSFQSEMDPREIAAKKMKLQKTKMGLYDFQYEKRISPSQWHLPYFRLPLLWVLTMSWRQLDTRPSATAILVQQ